MEAQREELGGERCHLHATDLELVRRAGRGEGGAFDELVDRHARDLYRLAFSLVGNAVDAEDVTQETLVGAFRQLQGFEARSSVKTWLIRILVRQAARCHRSRWRQRMVPLDRVAETPKTRVTRSGAASSESKSDIRMDVQEVLGALSPDHREVIALRELQGMSYKEMAEVLGVPSGTVESRLFRARQELKERLKDYLP